MGLFGSKGRNHINGYKELSKHAPVITLEKKAGQKVYFPTMAPNKSPINYTVKPGDKVLMGQRIGCRTDFYVPIYSSVSGEVKENEKIYSAQIGMSIPHIVIESDGMETKTTETLKTVSLFNSKEEIFAAIKESGIVGMGGAGFPTYIKYATTAPIDLLIINGVECEPYLTTDFVSMETRAKEVVNGVQFLLKASGASKAIIAIKVHKEEARDALIAESRNIENIEIREVPDVYPMGWEKVLIEEVSGRTYERLPSDCGVIENNVQTAMAINQVLTTGMPVTERLITVSGDAISTPCNVVAKLGTLAEDLIAACGGYNTDGEISLIPGGPMCSKSVTTEKFPMLLQMGSLTILKYKKVRTEACLRCGACSSNCPAHLQPVELKLAFESKNVDRMIALNAMSCVECGTCSYVCPSKIEITDYVKKCKSLIRLRAPKK